MQGAGGRTKRLEIFSRGLSIALIAAIFIGVVFLYKYDVFRDQLRLLIDYQKPGLGRWQESFVSTFFFQIHPFITLAALYSAYAAIRKKDLRYAVIAWLVLLVVLMQIKRIRYIIMVFPMLALMAAYGIHEIREKEYKKILCLICFYLFIYSRCFCIPAFPSEVKHGQFEGRRHIREFSGWIEYRGFYINA